MSLSKIGFGNQGFGSEPFGSADWAEEVTWKIIPEFYRNMDENPGGLVDKPLRGFIDSIKPLFQEIIDKWEIFPTLWDANKCPLPQLPALAYNVGISLTSIQNLQLINITASPFTIGEKITGSLSSSTGFISTVNGITLKIIGIKGSGFRIGDVITGASSKKTGTIQSVVGTGSIQTLTLQTFNIGETIFAKTTKTRATVGSTSSGNINVDTITGVGFLNGETVFGVTSGISGTINGITSDGKSPGLLRSQVLNASQLWTTKGTAKGYAIVAAFEGLLVLVVPLYAESCDPDPDGELLGLDENPNGTYMTYFDSQVADQLPMDKFYQDTFDAWPLNVESVKLEPDLPEGRCRSYSLRLFFFTPDNTEIENFEAVGARILTNLEKFRPIYVKFDSILFDGPRVSSQSWQTSAIAENSTIASWNTNIIGRLVSSSSSWNTSVTL